MEDNMTMLDLTMITGLIDGLMLFGAGVYLIVK
jgi:hypothetical protein